MFGEEKPAAEARGKSERPSRKAPKVVESDEELQDDALLGEATLAKMGKTRQDEVPAAPAAEVEVTPAPVEEKPAESKLAEENRDE